MFLNLFEYSKTEIERKACKYKKLGFKVEPIQPETIGYTATVWYKKIVADNLKDLKRKTKTLSKEDWIPVGVPKPSGSIFIGYFTRK